MKESRFEMTFDSKLENLPVMIDFVGESMERLGIDPGTATRVQIAVDEACTNVLKHAYEGGEGKITIICELIGDEFVIAVRDQGKPFDPRSVAPPDLDSSLEDRRIGGLGIYFMKKLMDDVSYRFDAATGNELTMKKKVAAKISPT